MKKEPLVFLVTLASSPRSGSSRRRTSRRAARGRGGRGVARRRRAGARSRRSARRAGSSPRRRSPGPRTPATSSRPRPRRATCRRSTSRRRRSRGCRTRARRCRSRSTSKARTGLRRVIVPTRPACVDRRLERGRRRRPPRTPAGARPEADRRTATQPDVLGPAHPPRQGAERGRPHQARSIEAELKQAEEAAKAKQSEEDRSKALDKLTSHEPDRHLRRDGGDREEREPLPMKADLDQLRTDPASPSPSGTTGSRSSSSTFGARTSAASSARPSTTTGDDMSSR